MRPQISGRPEADGSAGESAGRRRFWRRSIRLWTLIPPELCIALGALAVLAVGLSISDEARSWKKDALGRHGVFHKAPIEGLALAADARLAASASRDGTVKVWQIDAKLRFRGSRVVAESQAGFSSVAFAPDGRALVVGGLKGEVWLLDAATGRVNEALAGHPVAVRTVTFAPDGASVASGGDDRSVRVWDIHSRRARLVLTGHTGFVQQVVYSPDGRCLASVDSGGELILWDAATGAVGARFSTGGPLSSAAFAPDGRTLALGGLGRVVLCELASRRIRSYAAAPGWLTSLRYLPGGIALVSSGMDGSITLWDVAPGTLLSRTARRGHQGGVTELAVSPDGTVLLSGGNDNAVRLWSLTPLSHDAIASPPA